MRAAPTALSILIVIPALFALVFWYAADRGISTQLALAVLPAFLLEITLYVLAGLPSFRDRLARIPHVRLAAGLTLLAPVSWLFLTIPLGVFDPLHLAAILGLAAVASFWYVVLPKNNTAVDLLFLVVVAAPILFKLFGILYPEPTPRLPGQTVGVLMWYRTMLVAILCIRRMEGVNFGFLPLASEWRIGFINFLFFLPTGFVLAIAIGFAQLKTVTWDARLLLLTVLTFIGALWVIAVSEEFFFRGLLQQHLSRLTGSALAGLLIASVLFGSAHLAYRQFPNWKFAILATLAGIFYGRAYQQANSIRAAMVTHALVVTTWKVFLG